MLMTENFTIILRECLLIVLAEKAVQLIHSQDPEEAALAPQISGDSNPGSTRPQTARS